MSISEQYEAVFGGSCDPSRQKLRDLPYFVRVVSRKRKQSNKDEAVKQADGEKAENEECQCVYCERV